MIRATVSKVDLDFTGIGLRAGDLIDASAVVPAGHFTWPRVDLPIESATATNPPQRTVRAVIHTQPGELRRFCNDVLAKLDSFEKKS